MLVTNATASDYYFGPLHLPAGVGQTLTVDDTSAVSLYLLDDRIADAINDLAANGKISISAQALPFPRPTGVPAILHGDGSPEGRVFAGQGSIYLTRTAGSATNFLYTKTTGVSFNTGWAVINPGSGRFIAKGTNTANVATVATTYAAGADLLATAISFTADGVSDYLVTVICAEATTGGATNSVFAWINLDGGQNATILNGTFSNGQPIYAAGLVTPAAGAHTINVRIASGGAWTTTFVAGAGGTAVTPIIVGVEKAS